mmetsp:Transcript_33541/g.81074  ORF Transcript_33541/g.81074 Transcript_33541/m.81074 type:complete len:233 (-) Transcript_33541:1323-2021(-)
MPHREDTSGLPASASASRAKFSNMSCSLSASTTPYMSFAKQSAPSNLAASVAKCNALSVVRRRFCGIGPVPARFCCKSFQNSSLFPAPAYFTASPTTAIRQSSAGLSSSPTGALAGGGAMPDSAAFTNWTLESTMRLVNEATPRLPPGPKSITTEDPLDDKKLVAFLQSSGWCTCMLMRSGSNVFWWLLKSDPSTVEKTATPRSDPRILATSGASRTASAKILFTADSRAGL